MNINEIARAAHDMKPRDYNNTETYNALMRVIGIVKNSAIAWEYDNDEDNLQHYLSVLYAKHMPKAGKKPKTPEQWVSLAMAKKDVRYYLGYIYSDGNRIMATDGHRLHIYNTDKYEPGFYDANMVKVEDPDFAKFPDVDRVIPDNPHSMPIASMEFKHTGIDQSPTDYLINDIGVNSVYIDQALSIGEFTCVLFNDKSTAVSMSNGELLAVVMPIKLD